MWFYGATGVGLLRERCGFMARRLPIESYGSPQRCQRFFFKENEFFLRNFKKVNKCKKVRACIDTSHGRTCRQNHASYSAPGSP